MTLSDMSLSILNAYGSRKLTQRTYVVHVLSLWADISTGIHSIDDCKSRNVAPGLLVFRKVYIRQLYVWCMMALKKCRNM